MPASSDLRFRDPQRAAGLLSNDAECELRERPAWPGTISQQQGGIRRGGPLPKGNTGTADSAGILLLRCYNFPIFRIRRSCLSAIEPRYPTTPSLHSFVRRLNQLKRSSGPMESKVFISHASKDKPIAEAICEQLESEGIKCWIAPRDIEAGSDWTEGIIRGIDSCRVFVLVFSESANASEHVRREVAKAVSLGLAVIPFRTEDVNPSSSLSYFLGTVHWLDAITPPLPKHLKALTERVRHLLASSQLSAAKETWAKPRTQPFSFAPAKRTHWLIAVVLIGVATAIVFWFFYQRSRSSISEASLRSVAVLPFENISANKDDTYFADGVQDEILNSLAKIAQLKVISRTSVMQYRADAKRDLRQIANALGVANVLEGTVRREGSHVRVSTELVDARNDHTIWADSFDRDLTDIFAIQSEVAQTIARKLTTTLSPEEKKIIEQKPTDNLTAYDLYLRARESIAGADIALASGNFEGPLIDAIGLLQKAVQLDPKFALAYCAAAHAHDLLYITYDPTPDRRSRGDAALANALHLQPNLPEAHLTYAYHLYYCYRDYERAQVQLAMAKPGLPNNIDAIELPAIMDRRQGHFEKAIQEFNEALALDPNNANPMSDLAYTLYATRQFLAAEQVYERLINRVPDQPMLKVQKAWLITFMRTAADTTVRSAIVELPAATAKERGALSLNVNLALHDHDWARAKQLLEQLQGSEIGGEDDCNFGYATVPVPAECYSILVSRLQGDQPSANSSFVRTRDQLEQKVRASPGNALLLSALGIVDALLGHKEAAIKEAQRAVEMLPISQDAMDGPGVLANLAVVYAWTDQPDLAFNQLAVLTKTPLGIYYGQLKTDQLWTPIRQDPRFEKMLADLAPRD
jgi:TolB-like protein/Tfp pilus assembly protein PilF